MEEEEPAGLRFTPLLGTGPDDPVCGLLELDGHTLLLDCGWTQACTEQHIEALARCAEGAPPRAGRPPPQMHSCEP